MLIFQVLLLIIIVPLQYGPLARIALWHLASPDLLLLSVWLFAWLGERNDAIRWAVMLGLLTSLLNFQRFGLWLVVYLGIALAIDYAKRRFFQVSSLLEAIGVLVAANIVVLSVSSLLSGVFPYNNWLLNMLVNAVFGAVIYLLVARRMRLFQRWQGGRL